jgi:O-Antigen ligase
LRDGLEGPVSARDEGAGREVGGAAGGEVGGFPGGAVARVAAAALLAGPAALALARGGYFDEARLWAGIGVCVLVAVAALVAPRPLPRAASGLAALAGLSGLLAWTVASFGWAPLRAPAVDDAQRLALYLGALVAATALLRGGAARAAAPALAVGIVLATLYGLSERLLPDLFELTRSRAALGRLDQPLTYWNAMGAWAAIGLVLCARLAGDLERRPAMRAVAAAAAAPLGVAIALSFSRGAIAAALVGLGFLVALDPRRPTVLAVAVASVAAGLAGAAAAALPAVRTLEGARASEGLVLLAVLAALGAVAAVMASLSARAGEAAPRGSRRGLIAAAVVVSLGLAGAAAALERGTPEAGATATRLSSTASNRYSYWEVAASAFADAPLRGHGSGSFAADWLRERDVDEVVRDAHSLELETAAELGLVGLALLGLLAGGVVAAAVVALGRDRAVAAAPVAALAAWAAHSALDWDWEMPALTLVAVLLAGVLMGAADRPHARAPVPLRAGLALASLALAAGLAVELRSANLVAHARQVPTPPDALERLERASELSLDHTSPQIDQVRILLFRGGEREAAPIADAIVRREPQNAFAWELVRLANLQADPARAREAQAELRQLVRPAP